MFYTEKGRPYVPNNIGFRADTKGRARRKIKAGDGLLLVTCD